MIFGVQKPHFDAAFQQIAEHLQKWDGLISQRGLCTLRKDVQVLQVGCRNPQ
jgi:hypothetical protein